PIGRGGMGEVYLAADRRLGRRVALKLLPALFTQNAERLRRFEQEARAASALNHPNILTIYEIGDATGVHFIATEFIEGETLRQYLRNARPTRTKPYASRFKSQTRSPPRTRPASSIALSSRRTSCCGPT